MWSLVSRDSRSRVRHVEADIVVIAAGAHRDALAAQASLEGITEEVREDLKNR